MLSLLIACISPEDSAFVEPEDTSYRSVPRLQAVSASCVDGVIDFRARTIGWSNLAFVDIWYAGRVPDQYEAWEVPTEFFRRDEFCDFMHVKLNARDAVLTGTPLDHSTLRCPQFTSNNLTFLFQVWYEEGCAGAQVFGADPESVYADTLSVNGGPTVSPSNEDCLPNNADDPLIKGVVMEEVPPCSEPL